MTELSRLISRKIGRCGKCMRLSLTLMVLAWVSVLVVRLVWPTGAIWSAALVPTLGLTILWLLHIASFTARRVKAERQGRAVDPELPGDRSAVIGLVSEDQMDAGRRQVLRLVFKGTILALLTSLPFPRTSWAGCNTCAPGNINCRSTGNSCTNCCCPDGYPYLSYCDCVCYNASPDCNNYVVCR